MCRNLISEVPNDGFLLNALKRAVQYAKKKETNLFLDSVTASSAFATLTSMKQGEKTQKLWPNTYVIACEKAEKDASI